MDGFWPLGFIAAGCLSYFLLPRSAGASSWLLALPAVFVLAIRFLMPESPRWLEQAGRREQPTGHCAHRSTGHALAGPPNCRRRAPAPAGRPPSGLFSAFAELWSPPTGAAP
jgi:putative MFS transporter